MTSAGLRWIALALALAAAGGAAFVWPSSGHESRDAARRAAPVRPQAQHEHAFSDETKIFTVPLVGGRIVALRRASDDARGDEGDGAEERQLDNPFWSRDGRSIAFTRTPCEYCPPDLFVMDAHGTRVRRLSGIRNAYQPTWSPDGRRLAVLLPGEKSGIYSVGIRDGRARPLIRRRQSLEAPAWSPRGNRIAFALQRSATNWDIYSIAGDGTRLRPLTRAAAQETTPDWSPDGRRLAFARQLRSGNWAIWTMRADGSQLRCVTPRRISAVEPTWSPDGKRIAFSAQSGNDSSAIAVVDAHGGRFRRVTGRALFATQPAWSPRADVIAFAGREIVHEIGG
jgi:Tol biopolymer transport system component